MKLLKIVREEKKRDKRERKERRRLERKLLRESTDEVSTPAKPELEILTMPLHGEESTNGN